MNMDLVGAEVLAELPLPEPDEPKETDEWQSLVRGMLEEALQWRKENLEPLQEKATQYYKGEKFGNEEEGRSQVVMTEVRDVVMTKMPSLMRIFFGPENVVEFRPRKAEDIPGAEQATEYINFIIREDNDGFLAFHSVFQDAEVRKLGVIKWWVEEMERVEASEHSGLTAEQVGLLMEPGADISLTQSAEGLFDAVVKRTVTDKRFRLAALPPEEFVWSPSARSRDEARMVAHVRYVPASDLIAMGIDPVVVEAAKGEPGNTDNRLDEARRVDGGVFLGEDAQDEATEDVRFAEVYARIDADEDGIAELRLLKCVGEQCIVVNGDGRGEIVDERPFALFCPNPEAHAIIGLSDADLVMDLQLIKSDIMRGVLDSLGSTLDPDTVVDINRIRNVSDLMNRERGRVIRGDGPPANVLQTLVTPFVGEAALPVMAYLDETRDGRTGTTKASAGLDADVLQSTTKAAVEMTRDGSRQRLELTARIYAETGMKQLFKGLLRLVTRHQDQPRLVRLRNEYVTVDPRHWDATMDVQVNVALGSGTVEDKIQALALMLEKQEAHFQMGSPLARLSHIRNTLGRLTELLGHKDSNEFWAPWTAAEDQAMEQQKAQQQPPPDPATMLAQVEQLKVQMEAQRDSAKLALEEKRILLEDDRERDRMAQEMALKKYELELKHAADIKEAELRADVAANRQNQNAA